MSSGDWLFLNQKLLSDTVKVSEVPAQKEGCNPFRNITCHNSKGTISQR